MRYKHRDRTIQLGVIIFCCLFVAVTRTEVPGAWISSTRDRRVDVV